MKIAVNTRVLLKDRLDGIGWFTFETLKRITRERDKDHFYFIFDRPFSEEFVFSSNVEPVVIGPPARHPALWYYWFEIQLPRLFNILKPDIFVSPDGYLSLKSQVKSVAVVHDINFVHFPIDFPFSSRLYYNYFFPKYAEKAVRLATVSEFSKTDIIQNFNIEPSKIDVLYNGYNQIYNPLDLEQQVKVKARYSGGEDYFVFVGSMHPRKNVANMLLAFEKFKNSTLKKFKFILVGEAMFNTGDIKKVLKSMKNKSDVILLGRMEPMKIRDLLASAMALILVSKFEGFGIPVIEAMKCHTPAIVSNVASLPEIAGDAALYANPFSVDSICQAMLEMTNHPGMREKLIENGKKVIQLYSWDKTSRLFWNCISKTTS